MYKYKALYNPEPGLMFWVYVQADTAHQAHLMLKAQYGDRVNHPIPA